MGDYIRDIVKRKKENIEFVKMNYRWWFECAPNSVEEFDFMLAEKELEIIDYRRKEGIMHDLVYKEFNEPVIHVYKSETGEVIIAKFTEKNELYKQWVKAQIELELEDGIVDYKNGKWDVVKQDGIYKKYIEYDTGDIINNCMMLIDKYTNEVYTLLMDLDVTNSPNYYKQRLQKINAKMKIYENDLKKIKIEIERNLKTIEKQEE